MSGDTTTGETDATLLARSRAIVARLRAEVALLSAVLVDATLASAASDVARSASKVEQLTRERDALWAERLEEAEAATAANRRAETAERDRDTLLQALEWAAPLPWAVEAIDFGNVEVHDDDGGSFEIETVAIDEDPWTFACGLVDRLDAIRKPEDSGTPANPGQDLQGDANCERHRSWHKWLNQEAARQGFTKPQIRRATAVCQQVPRTFLDVPSAMRDAEDKLCLTWEVGGLTLSVEIDPIGEDDWWAYSTQTKQYVAGRSKCGGTTAKAEPTRCRKLSTCVLDDDHGGRCNWGRLDGGPAGGDQ